MKTAEEGTQKVGKKREGNEDKWNTTEGKCVSHTHVHKHAHTHTPFPPTHTSTPEVVLLSHSLRTDEREMKTEKKQVNWHFQHHSARPRTNLDMCLKPQLPISCPCLCLTRTHTDTQHPHFHHPSFKISVLLDTFVSLFFCCPNIGLVDKREDVTNCPAGF